ncbi:DUF4013 domain-containing protein [Halococcoides cellulosivorans]|nr:DUF4013 domain-containing protein [Halococcoides cellulosivorans]
MVEFEDAITYPLEDDDWLSTIGIGGGLFVVNLAVVGVGLLVAAILSLVFVGVALFPLVILLGVAITLPVGGYYMAVLRATIEGDDDPPRFEDWERLFEDGLIPIAVSLVYTVPLVVVLVVVGVLAALGVGIVTTLGGDAAVVGGLLIGSLGVVVFSLVVAVYVTVMPYFVPISMAIYAHEGDLRTAFDHDRITQVAFTKAFAIYWTIAFGIQFVAGQFIGLLYLAVIGVFLQFYLGVVTVRLYGLGYVAAMDLDSAD